MLSLIKYGQIVSQLLTLSIDMINGEMGQQMSVDTCLKYKILLIIALICLKTCIHVAEVYLEGSLSPNFDIGFS